MRFLIGSVLLALFLTGCATKDKVVVQEIFIPVKCKVEVPERPMRSGSVEDDILNVLVYTEKLEIVVDKCVDKGE